MHSSLPHCFKSLCLFYTKYPKEQANVQQNKEITHCALQNGHYLAAFLLPFVLFLRAKLHFTPLFISSYDFAANVINESTQRLCVVITILFSSLTFAASSKKAKFFICDSGNRFCAGSSTTLKKMNWYIYSKRCYFGKEFHLKRSLKFQMS